MTAHVPVSDDVFAQTVRSAVVDMVSAMFSDDDSETGAVEATVIAAMRRLHAIDEADARGRCASCTTIWFLAERSRHLATKIVEAGGDPLIGVPVDWLEAMIDGEEGLTLRGVVSIAANIQRGAPAETAHSLPGIGPVCVLLALVQLNAQQARELVRVGGVFS